MRTAAFGAPRALALIGGFAMKERDDQLRMISSDIAEVDAVPEPKGPSEDSQERMNRLRAAARSRSHVRNLIDDAQAPSMTERRKKGGSRKWAVIAGAASALLCGGVAMAAFSAGGDSVPASTPEPPPAAATKPPAGSLLPGAPTEPAASTTETATASAGATVEPPAEGAVSESSLREVPALTGPLLAIPARRRVRIVEPFGTPRGKGLVHAGVDVASPTGTSFDVVAGCDGRVLGIDRLSGYGDFVVVECDRSVRTVYAGLDAVTAKVGDEVRIGSYLVGKATMLHYEVRWNGIPLDPAQYIDFSADPSVTPTPVPTETPKASATATPTPPGSSSPEPTGPASTPTSGPPTATPTATPVTPTATPTVTPTRTPKPPTPTPTSKPIVR